MTQLSELFNPSDLYEDVQQGYVRIQTHPTLPLRIMNYAEKAVFDRVWTPVTRQCRGLIVNDKDEVLARPFAKFFNWNEPLAPVIGLEEMVSVSDKVDGSLGILYPTGDGGYAVATRGSFMSDQAQHATALYQERYADTWTPSPDYTYLFEIVYPENRIVVDYKGQDDLVLLAAVITATGEPTPASSLTEWPGPVVHEWPYMSFAQALAMPPRDGMEGLVVMAFLDTMVKIKQDEYVRLHRIVTGLNARAVWESMGGIEGSIEDLCAELPDEFHEWTKKVARDLVLRADDILWAATKEYARLTVVLGKGFSRKDYALQAKDHPLAGYLFRLLDGREIDTLAWKAVYPEGNVTPSGRTFTEATA